MNKDAALVTLGLSGNEDAATIARAYGERLTAIQGALVSAQTDADRGQCQTKLSELLEAYEFVTGTGRYTKDAANDANATFMRSEPATELAPPPGDTFVRMEPGAVLSSRLEIGALLGSGGMGNVYAARDRLKEEDVAIKVLRQDLLFSTMAKERFLAEAKVSCSLSHPNIVRVHDVGVSGGYYYLSMERLKGHNLRQRIEAYWREHRDFTVEEVTDIARQLIDALRYAHRYIVHRDIKPENIWLAEDGTVKLMDFGIARAFTSSQLTQTGMALGTAYYMAPEQRIAAKEVDWRADQYALGVVLYELFAGTLPTGAVKPLEELRKDVPKRFARALMRAMASKPHDRFSSLHELLAEIESPRRKALGIGGLLLIGAGVAAAAAGVYVVVDRQMNPPAEVAATTSDGQTASGATSEPSPATSGADASQIAASPEPQGTDTPPPGDSSSQAAAALPPAESPPQDVARTAAVPEATPTQTAADASPVSREPVSAPAPTRVAAVDRSASDSARQQCITQCERDDGECRSINRRAKQDCMRAVAFSGTGRLTTTISPTANCAFYVESRCDNVARRDACVASITDRYQACMGVFGDSIASRRQDCEDRSHDADRLCMDELRDCRSYCQ